MTRGGAKKEVKDVYRRVICADHVQRDRSAPLYYIRRASLEVAFHTTPTNSQREHFKVLSAHGPTQWRASKVCPPTAPKLADSFQLLTFHSQGACAAGGRGDVLHFHPTRRASTFREIAPN
jgi:hypothetical protein